MSHGADAGRERIPEIDGMRGLAILSVLTWHYLVCQAQAEPGSLTAYGLRLLSLTWAGVDVFFVLSGFLLGGALLDNRHAANYFRAFYARRFCRIVPLYFVMLALFAAAATLGLDREAAGYRWLFADSLPMWTYATFTHNFAMVSASVFGPNWMSVTWSLAVEEQFYLLLPLFIRVVAPAALPWALVTVVASAPLVRGMLLASYADASLAGYVLLPARWDALFLGVLVAWALRRAHFRQLAIARASWLYSAVAVLICMLGLLLYFKHGLGSVAMTRAGYTIVAMLAACLVVCGALLRGSPIARLLRNAVLVRFGVISYGVYLLHQPVSGLLHQILRGQVPRMASGTDAAVTLLAFGVTVVLAHFSWRWLESPVIRRGHTMRYQADRRHAVYA